ncbi:MAG: hypothetical protein K6F63_07230 [Lachnospiraceae bacterium]|nr:hypothetical protein [Lachnospiraceae bacterium]
MNKKFTSRHGAVMMEPVIAISFFAIISVFLLRMFASTEKIRSSADEVSKAVIRAEAAMEYMLAGEDTAEDLERSGFGKLSADGREYMVKYYDKDWRETEKVGKYMMTIFTEDEKVGSGKFINYELRVSKVNEFENSGEIYSLSAKKYVSGGA